MQRAADFIVAHHRRVLVLTGMLTALSALMFLRLDFNADISAFMKTGSAEGEAFAALQEKYDTADPVNVMLSLPPGETFHVGTALAEVARVRDTLLDLDEVALVTSLVPGTNPLTGSPVTAEFLEALPPFAIEQLTGANPLTDFLLSPDGRHTLLMVVPEGDDIRAARAIDDVYFGGSVEVTISGNPVIYSETIEILGLILVLIPPAVIVLLLLVFQANVGDIKLTALSLFPALVGTVWTFGLIFALGREIDIVTVIVPIFVIVMGSADGLHFVTHFQGVAARTKDPSIRVRSTLEQVGKPMILTTISTAVGFLSLFSTDVGPIRQMGLYAAIGITFAGVISFFSLPALFTHLDISGRQQPPRTGAILVRALQAGVRTRIPAAAVTIGLLALAIIFIPRLTVDSDPLFMFGPDHEVRQAFGSTEELFGGATPLVGEFVFDPDSPDVSFAAAMASTARLEDLPTVRAVVSVASLMEVLPTDALDEILSGELDLPTGRMVSEDGLRFILLTQDLGSGGLDELRSVAAQDPAIRNLTGMTIIWDSMADLVLRAQVWSVTVALVLVTVMLLVTYRRLRSTLVAVLPLVLTIGGLLGFIAATGINLNLITAVASSIVIGVGIDYAIHFVAAIQHAEADGPGYVLRALDRVGRPIVANALGIAVGLTGLWFSPLVPHHHISAIMWFSMVIGALTTLLVIPALLPREGVIGLEGTPRVLHNRQP